MRIRSTEVGGSDIVTGRLTDIQLEHHLVVKLKTVRESTNGPIAINDHFPS